MSEFEEKVLEDLATLKAQMKQLVGNGQPGRLAQLEERVERHEGLVHRVAGGGAVMGAVITGVHFFIDWLRH